MYQVDDKLITKKPHACGGDSWIVLRNGADYKLMCEKCNHIIMVDAMKLEKMVKRQVKPNEK